MCAGPSDMGTRSLWRHLQGIERQGLLSVAVQAGVLVETVLGRARGMGGRVREPGVTDLLPTPHSALGGRAWLWGLGDPVLGFLSCSPHSTPCSLLLLSTRRAPRDGSARSPPYPPVLGHLRLQVPHRVAAEALHCRESAPSSHPLAGSKVPALTRAPPLDQAAPTPAPASVPPPLPCQNKPRLWSLLGGSQDQSCA